MRILYILYMMLFKLSPEQLELLDKKLEMDGRVPLDETIKYINKIIKEA